jgi:hypothetical protein
MSPSPRITTLLTLGFDANQPLVEISERAHKCDHLYPSRPARVRLTGLDAAHQGAIWGGFVAPVIAYYAVDKGLGFALPMLIGTAGSLAVLVMAVFLGPEIRGKVLSADSEIIKLAEVP